MSLIVAAMVIRLLMTTATRVQVAHFGHIIWLAGCIAMQTPQSCNGCTQISQQP
jgi:hypothetical protein